MPVRRLLLLLAVLIGGAVAYAASGSADKRAGQTGGVQAAQPANMIWGALVLASNAASPNPPPPELQACAPRLKRVFGYNQYEIIGSASNELGERAESWLVPTKSFWLALKARRATSKETRGGYLLNLQLFQEKRPLLETDVKLAPGSPLFIRGPEYGDGQLIIVLQVQP